MANAKVTVSIKDTEAFTDLLDKLKALVHQVEINGYTDGLGHELKMNKSYVEFKEFLGGMK